MRGYLFPIGLMVIAPAANAECLPGFVDGGNSVAVMPTGLDDPQISERFQVRLRNDGSSSCEVRLAIGRDMAASDPAFPTYTLAGPSGAVNAVDASAARLAASSFVDVIVPPGGEVAVPFDLRFRLGWGSEAGSYSEALDFFLFRRDSRAEIATQRTMVNLTVPTAARIRFAGASGGRGAARLEMGALSSVTPTVSPPFAIRVLSTSGYQMQLESENAGALRRTNGPERIPYRMTVDNRPLNLAGGGDMISVGRHTSSVGDVHPVSVVVDPDPARHAGEYRDRVTVTVTPI